MRGCRISICMAKFYKRQAKARNTCAAGKGKIPYSQNMGNKKKVWKKEKIP